jgi:hypothetical protein
MALAFGKSAIALREKYYAPFGWGTENLSQIRCVRGTLKEILSCSIQAAIGQIY